MFGHLIKYSEAYTGEEPQNPIDLIKGIPKAELIATIVAINSRINPIYSQYTDDSRETQVECLRVIFLDNQNPIEQSVCLKFIKGYLLTPRNHFIVSRATCLYAIQEILASNIFTQDTPVYTVDIRENIFKFLLIINSKILTFDKYYKEGNADELGENFFDFFMFKELIHNQYLHNCNTPNFFYKSFVFLKTLESDETFGNHFKNYLQNTFSVSSFVDFFKNQMYTYFISYDKILKFNFLNIQKSEKDAIKILNVFSNRNSYTKPEFNDPKIFDFLDIKKSPLYKQEDNLRENTIAYIVLDNKLFLEKNYSLFINDFWFDYLKPNNICKRNDWGNFVGSKFFEPFIENIFNISFKNNKNIIFKHTDELKIKLNGKTEVEYADYYIRFKNKIILAEAKSNYLPIINGYKTVITKDDFEKIDTEKFYKDYGVVQLVKKTIKEFHNYKWLLKDIGFNFNRKVEIYPILIVNDYIFSSGYSSIAFKRKFEKLMKEEGIDIENDQHKIHPLTIFNVADLQNIQNTLENKTENIFNIIRHYHSSTSFEKIKQTKNTSLGLLTIEHSINKLIKKGLVPKNIKNLDWLE